MLSTFLEFFFSVGLDICIRPGLVLDMIDACNGTTQGFKIRRVYERCQN